ncbi:oligopeptide transport system permease protein [Peptoclostridium litorale DSM 5388]|uniref:Oligopeptide transport system permease protein OppB n=1 Tax=Peptoclostridium litorale DSM 5388 TaxID=1121324 RepID=A0A069RFA8_PEPLI|nr:ABC transporter permease [Peptoclostridium litorale]KDR95686.1 oligopeptide transport system permease protein OppB [Peptoclostridium litorale DSM 5388]SIO01085.1 oligopeptide transport system permease protein [Peptoclostridium litorale DSM 5388]
MGRFILSRLVSMVVTIFLIITITFFLMHAIPGGPFASEKKLPEAIEKALNEKYHLDDPLHKQYVDYLKGVAVGDFGPSFKLKGQNVSDIIAQRFPVSAQLGGIAIFLILIAGIPLGVVAALKQGTWVDNMVMFLAIIGVTIPSFVIATVMIYTFSVKLGWLPPARWGEFDQMIMPSIALAAYAMAFVARLTRSSMLEVISQDYIRTARAKGLTEKVVVFKHALKNALIPIVTYIGPLSAGIMTGSFVIEKIFAVPGLGRFFVDSITSRDYTVIMGVTIFYATFLVIMILVVDILYAFIDPRIKLDQ